MDRRWDDKTPLREAAKNAVIGLMLSCVLWGTAYGTFAVMGFLTGLVRG